MTEQEADQNPEQSFYDHEDNTFVLSRDYLGATRLALQQYLWQDVLGYNIKPSISLPKKPRIADVACRTGLWLLHLASSLGPSARLDGFDVTLEQSPPAAWLPSNVKLHNWNYCTEPPAEFVGVFDLVHVRMVGLVVKNDEPDQIMHNLRKLLKPGGWLQWDELDTFKSYIAKADPKLNTPAMDEWCEWAKRPKERLTDPSKSDDYDWKHALPAKLKSIGFKNTTCEYVLERFEKRMDLAKFNNDQLILLTEHFTATVLGSTSSRGKYMREMMEQVKDESKKGAALILSPMVFTAQKG